MSVFKIQKELLIIIFLQNQANFYTPSWKLLNQTDIILNW